jgi:hypothetical protein
MWNMLCEGEVSSERGEGKWRGSRGYGWFAFFSRVGRRSCGLNSALGTGKASILTLAASLQCVSSGFVGHGSWEVFALVDLEPGSSLSLVARITGASHSPTTYMYFLHVHLYGTVQPTEVILRWGMGQEEQWKRWDKTNWDIIYVYMEIHNGSPCINTI